MLATPVSAERVLLCFPGGPGSTSAAQKTVNKFLSRLAGPAGWKSATGAYYTDVASCESAFKKGADVVMIPLHVYLSRQKSWKLVPAATMKNKEASGQFHVYAPKGTSLASLSGKTVTTSLKAGNRFMARVAFSGKLPLGKGISVNRVRSARRAIKNLLKGKAAAAIIDDVQLKSFKGLPLTSGLAAIHSGPALPAAITALVGKGKTTKLTAALTALCKKDRALCKEMRVTGFGPVKPARLKALSKALD